MEALKDSFLESNDTPSIRFNISSHITQIRMVAISVRSLVADLDFKDASASGIELALVELMTNCATHTLNNHSNAELVVDYQLFKSELHIRTTDSGDELPVETQQRINSTEVAMQELSSDVMLLPESGWGISLMKSLSQSLSYERVRNTNVFTLTFALNS